MSESDGTQATGIGFFGMLGILFIGLKLTGYISWSWWWVLLPLYWWLIVLAVVFLGAVVFDFIASKVK